MRKVFCPLIQGKRKASRKGSLENLKQQLDKEIPNDHSNVPSSQIIKGPFFFANNIGYNTFLSRIRAVYYPVDKNSSRRLRRDPYLKSTQFSFVSEPFSSWADLWSAKNVKPEEYTHTYHTIEFVETLQKCRKFSNMSQFCHFQPSILSKLFFLIHVLHLLLFSVFPPTKLLKSVSPHNFPSITCILHRTIPMIITLW